MQAWLAASRVVQTGIQEVVHLSQLQPLIDTKGFIAIAVNALVKGFPIFLLPKKVDVR